VVVHHGVLIELVVVIYPPGKHSRVGFRNDEGRRCKTRGRGSNDASIQMLLNKGTPGVLKFTGARVGTRLDRFVRVNQMYAGFNICWKLIKMRHQIKDRFKLQFQLLLLAMANFLINDH